MAAKKFGVYCYEFSFGMGPLLFKKQGKETQYSIRAIPVGGFVSMAGEEDGDEAYPDVSVPEGRRLTDKPWWQKVIIMLAGVFMNFVLAYVIFSLVTLYNGAISISPDAVVGSVMENSAAEEAGFQAGDIILKIEKDDGTSIEPDTFLDMQSFVLDDSTYTYTIERDGEVLEITVVPEYSEDSESYIIGIYSTESEIVETNILNCWYYGLYEMGLILKLMMQSIATIFQGAGLSNLSGPVGVYEATETYASYGFETYMFLVAQISLSVGIFNLIPLPVLDGGQVVITIGEAIARRKLNEKFKMGMMLVCWALLLGLMAFVTWKDIVNLLF